MTICNGITKSGKKCRATATYKGYCRWHIPEQQNEECVVCCELIDESVLPCGHWVHRECVQKSADALQEVRASEGYPPIETCTCPICRTVVPDMIPKEAPSVPNPITIIDVNLSQQDIQSVYQEWEQGNRITPINWYIWVKLNQKYPDENPDHLLIAAYGFESLINIGTINPYPPRLDPRFSQVLNRSWR